MNCPRRIEMRAYPSLRLLSCATVILFLIVCNLPPSQASPTPSERFAQPMLQATASPTPGATLAQTQVPTESPTLAATPAGTASATPVFDITTRTGQPPLNDEADYLVWMQANTPEDPDYLNAKWARAQSILTNQDATDPRIIEAFLRTPREDFFDATTPIQAYASYVYPIGYGQTIPGPHLVCHMI